MNLRESQELFWRAARREASSEEITQCFAPSSTVSALGRMDVYAGAFFARQEKALRELLPKTHELLGDDFGPLARRYTLTHPGRHPAMERFTNDFAAFLAETPGYQQAAALSNLELSRNLALRAPADPAPPLSLEQLQCLSPHSLLHVSGSAHLVATDTSSFALFTRSPRAEQKGTQDSIWVLFFRKGFVVRHRCLESDEAQAIERLEGGVTLAALCETFVEHEEPARRAHAVISTFLNDQILFSPSTGSLS